MEHLTELQAAVTENTNLTHAATLALQKAQGLPYVGKVRDLASIVKESNDRLRDALDAFEQAWGQTNPSGTGTETTGTVVSAAGSATGSA